MTAILLQAASGDVAWWPVRMQAGGGVEYLPVERRISLKVISADPHSASGAIIAVHLGAPML